MIRGKQVPYIPNSRCNIINFDDWTKLQSRDKAPKENKALVQFDCRNVWFEVSVFYGQFLLEAVGILSL